MKCFTCGNDNPANARFCGNCRQLLVEESTESTPAVSGIGIGTAELPMVSFQDAIKRGFNNYATFSGRATRAEFWWFYLFLVIGSYGSLLVFGILAAALMAIAAVLGLIAFGIVYVAQLFVFGIPWLALCSRRLHDGGRSGWFFLLFMVPFGGIFLIVWFCQKGNAGPNRYGPDPRQPTSQQSDKP